MRRSVVMAGIVVVSMAVLPSAAFADQLPGAAVPARPMDCPSAGADPGGGSGTGDPATPGDGSGSGPSGPGGDPSGDDKGAGGSSGEKPDASGGEKQDSSSGDKPDGSGSGAGEGVADENPPSGDGSGGDKAGDGSGGDKAGDGSGGGKSGDQSAGDKSGGDKSGGDKSGGDKSGDGSGGQEPGDGSGDKSTGDQPAGEKPAADKPAGDDPGDQAAGDEPAGDKPAAGAEPDPCAAPKAPGAPADPAAPAGAETSAAVKNNWGEPNRVDDFDGDLGDWSLYDGEGHAGNGRRSPDAATTKDGLLTINGDGDGTTAGMAWNPGQKYGRWEGRVKAPASDPTYNALLLLWPDAENFPVGGEVDFMEMTDHTRQKTNMFLHYGADNSQVQGDVQIDATQWHNWAVEWTPEKVTAFVDGKEWWSTTDTSILPPGPMHLCIQLDWFPGNGGGDVKPSEMQVDWVRQYPLPESEQGGAGDGSDKSGDDKGGGDKGGSEGLLDGVGGALDRLTRRTEGAPDPVGSAQRGPSGAVTGTP